MRDFANLHGPGKQVNFQGRVTVALVAGIVFGWLGPFDTNELPIFTSLGFWTLMCFLWIAIASLIGVALERFTRIWHRLGKWQRMALTTVLTAPIGAVIAGVALSGLDRWKPSVLEAFDLLSQTIVVGAMLEIIAAGTLRAEESQRANEVPSAGMLPDIGGAPVADPIPDHAAAGMRETTGVTDREGSEADNVLSAEQPVNGVSPPLLKRLPPGAGQMVLCLQMEDHYVRVHTEHGSSLILMRLKDAIVELTGVEGLQVHRSWWVARDAIRTATPSGRTMTLHLSNELIVPVSQPYMVGVMRILSPDI